MEPSLLLDHLSRLAALEGVIEPIAVLVFAISGIVPARNRGLDLVGGYIVAFVTALGGGTLRDILLDRRPFFWVQHPQYPILILLLVIGFLYAPRFKVPCQAIANRYFNLIDAWGLGLFSISGTAAALALEMPWFTASLYGVITGVFGGVLRDVLLAEIPLIFRQKTSLYATCAFVGTWVFMLSLGAGLPEPVAGGLGITTVVLMRLLSLKYQITLPLPPDARHLEPSNVPESTPQTGFRKGEG